MPYTEHLSIRKEHPLSLLCRIVIMAFAVGLAPAASAAAQGWTPPDPTTDPWNSAKLRIGPFFMAPSFDLRDVGIDNNVFRDEANPRQDLTATIAVKTVFGAHIRAFNLRITQDNRYLWFRRYTSERSIDGGLLAIAELRLQRMRPWISVSKLKSTDRAGFEIDTRASRTTPDFETGIDVNLGLRTGLTASFKETKTEYAEGQFFDGVNLKKSLDNRRTFAHVNGRWQYSEFSDILGAFEWSRNRFTYDPLRSGDTVSYMAGFQSRGDSPITGRVQLGYKVQHHDDRTVPDFSGVVLSALVSTVVSDRIKLDVSGDRDLQFSYDDHYPFYVQQGGSLKLTARVNTRLDLIGSALVEWLHYSDSYLSAGLPLTSRTDLATVLGLGFLYFVGGPGGSHLGLTFERGQRDSPLPQKTYRNDRVLTNLRFSF